MNKLKAVLCSLLMVTAAFSATACGKGSDSSGSNNYEDQTMAAEKKDDLLAAAKDDELLSGELENKTIKWMSDWDINPDGTGKKTPADLLLFQEIYGGKVEYHYVTYNERYDKLAAAVTSGDGIDFFYSGNLDAIPKGAISGMFAPTDDYIDYDSPLWKDVKSANDSIMWNGKHYAAIVQISGDNVACIYNRKTMQEAGLEDPADLYENGEWTWETFQSMLEKFVDNDNGKYGIDSWWFEFGLINTTGVTPVSIKDGKLVSNLADPNMERVQNWLYELYNKGYIAIGSENYDWETKPHYIGEGKLLFYPVGLYELYYTPDIWKAKYGEDAFFVPMPKDPEADEYYIPVGMEAYSMVSGGANPEGVAKYLDCKRYVVLNEDAAAVANSIYIDDYGWTQEMLDMKESMQELADANPNIDLSKGISTECGKILDDSLRLTTRGTPWNETYDTIYAVVDAYLKDANEGKAN